LDRETRRIDALIDNRRRLLELLEEERLAVIAQAVTKGLNSNVPMKDSGESHIGYVPAHWTVIALRRVLDCRSGDSLANRGFERDATDECRTPAVGGNGTLGYTTEPNSPGGTLVIGRVGAHCGNVHLVLEPCWVTDNALRVTWRRPIHPPYIKRLLEGIGLNRIANRNAQPLVTGSMIKAELVPIPSQAEQENIAAYLDNEEDRIDRLNQIEMRAIKLLQEYRSALITAAVSGKIDVRGQAEHKEAAE
jgi:type I restriction enzyme, S subunit